MTIYSRGMGNFHLDKGCEEWILADQHAKPSFKAEIAELGLRVCQALADENYGEVNVRIDSINYWNPPTGKEI